MNEAYRYKLITYFCEYEILYYFSLSDKNVSCPSGFSINGVARRVTAKRREGLNVSEIFIGVKIWLT